MSEEKRVAKLLDIGIREIIALSKMCNEMREGLRVLAERVERSEPIGKLLDDQVEALIPELRGKSLEDRVAVRLRELAEGQYRLHKSLKLLVERVVALEAMEGALVERVRKLEEGTSCCEPDDECDCWVCREGRDDGA